MSPSAYNLSYFQTRKDKMLLRCGFKPAKIPLTELAPMEFVLTAVKLGQEANLFSNTFLNALQQQAEKPFALCLYADDGFLSIAIPFDATDESFQAACEALTAQCNHSPALPQPN